MQVSDGGRRFTAAQAGLRKALHTAMRSGPRWESSRTLTSGAAAAVAVLAVTGVVALTTTGGSSPTRTRDVAATTKPAPEPHYLLPIAALVRNGSVPPPTLSGDTSTVGVPRGTVAPPTKPSTTNRTDSTITTYRGASGTLTPAGIATLALEQGCSPAQAPTATAVAMAESGGSPSAQGDVTLMTAVWDWSAGLWQIRGLRAQRGTGALRDSIANQRATTNAAAMYAISSGCTNWSPWTTYTRGLYLGYTGVAQQAVDYVLAYFAKHGHYPTVASPDPTAVIPVATGGGPVAPAAAAGGSSTARPTKPKASTPAKAPAAPRGAAPTPASGGGQPAGGGTSTRTSPAPASPTPTPTPTPTKSTPKPKLPITLPPILPTSPIPLPSLSLPHL